MNIVHDKACETCNVDIVTDLARGDKMPKDMRCKLCSKVTYSCPSCFGESCPYCQGERVMKSKSFPDNIFKAVKEGDQDEVRAIYRRECCDLSSLENENGFTPLTLAVFEHDIEMCKFLIIEMTVDVCYQNLNNGRTTLIEMMQARSSKTSIKIMDLLKRSVHLQDNSGKTALMFASVGAGLFGSKCGNPKLINRLLNYGADLFAQDKTGCTALGWAIESNNQSKKKTNDEVINLLEGEMLKEAAIREFKKHFYYEFDHKGNFHSRPKN
jgi:hypothetical protein